MTASDEFAKSIQSHIMSSALAMAIGKLPNIKTTNRLSNVILFELSDGQKFSAVIKRGDRRFKLASVIMDTVFAAVLTYLIFSMSPEKHAYVASGVLMVLAFLMGIDVISGWLNYLVIKLEAYDENRSKK